MPQHGRLLITIFYDMVGTEKASIRFSWFCCERASTLVTSKSSIFLPYSLFYELNVLPTTLQRIKYERPGDSLGGGSWHWDQHQKSVEKFKIMPLVSAPRKEKIQKNLSDKIDILNLSRQSCPAAHGPRAPWFSSSSFGLTWPAYFCIALTLST